MPKIKFIINFFIEILHFKEPWFYWLTAFGPITGDPEFCQIWDWCWNINTNISFHFRLFPRKTNDPIIKTKPYFGVILAFVQIWAKIDFPWKKVSESF